jgi:transposase
MQDPAVNRHRPPSTPKLPVEFYGDSWKLVSAEELKDSQVLKAQRNRKFQWWVKIQGFTPYKQTYIPLSGYNPLIKHDLAKTLSLRRHNGRWQFTVFEQTPDPGFQTHVDVAPEGAEVIGVDVGLNALASLSNGKQYSTDFKSRFDRDREKILKLRKNRQKQGLKENSPRLQRLEDKLTHKVKVVSGFVANKIVKDHPSATFALENLDLRGCKGQKRFAYRAVALRLMQKAYVVVVNPAYTSQECSRCSHTEAGNRNGEVFQCRKCGLQTNADTNASINIMRRSHDRRITAKMTHWQVAAVLGVVRAPKGALTSPTPSGIGPPVPLAPSPVRAGKAVGRSNDVVPLSRL